MYSFGQRRRTNIRCEILIVLERRQKLEENKPNDK